MSALASTLPILVTSSAARLPIAAASENIKDLAQHVDPDTARSIHDTHQLRQNLVQKACKSTIETGIVHGAVIDRTLDLEAADFQNLIDLMIAKSGIPEQDAASQVLKSLDEAKDRVSTKVELIANLIGRFTGSGEAEKIQLQASAEIPELDLWLAEVYRAFSLKNEGLMSDRPGGGTANMLRSVSPNAAQLITAIIPPVSNVFAAAFANSEAKVLKIEGTQVSEPLLSESGDASNPMLTNYVIELNSKDRNSELKIGDRKIPITTTAGRIIFKASMLINEHGAYTNSIELKRPSFNIASGLNQTERAEVLQDIGKKHPLIILNGGAYIDPEYVETFLADLAEVAKGQSKASKPSLIHLELSGNVPQLSKLCANDSTKYSIKSLGLSDGEIPSIYESVTGKKAESVKNKPDLALEYASAIAETLKLDRLHVHSGSKIPLDIIIRKSGIAEEQGVLKAEALAAYWKNYVIHSKLLNGNFDHDPKKYQVVFEKSALTALAQIASKFAADFGDSALNEVRFDGIFLGSKYQSKYSYVFVPVGRLPEGARYFTGAGDTACRSQTRGAFPDYVSCNSNVADPFKFFDFI